MPLRLVQPRPPPFLFIQACSFDIQPLDAGGSGPRRCRSCAAGASGVSSLWLTGRRSHESREALGPSAPLLERPGPALVDRRPLAASGPSDQRPNQRAQILGPSESQGARGPSLGCPASPASGPTSRTRGRLGPSVLHSAAGSARGRARPRPTPPPQGHQTQRAWREAYEDTSPSCQSKTTAQMNLG
jgi:hypothetical protein